MSWLKCIWAVLIALATTTIFTLSSALLILWPTTSRYVARSCAHMPIIPNDCGGWVALGYAVTVVAGCGLFGLFIGAVVGIGVYRRQNSNSDFVQLQR